MKRLLRTNNRTETYGIRPLTAAFAIVALLSGCSPRLAPVGTGGLLSRSINNYSQSTVVRSEALVTSGKPDMTKEPAPKQESRWGKSTNSTISETKSHSQVIAPVNYTEPRSNSSNPVASIAANNSKTAQEYNDEPVVAPRSSGIPKVNENAVSGLRNVTFVTQPSSAPTLASVTPTAPVADNHTQNYSAAPKMTIASGPREMTAKEQRTLLKKQRADAKRMLAERATANNKSTAPAKQRTAQELPVTPTQQQPLYAQSTDNSDNNEPGVEDFLPSVSQPAIPSSKVDKPAPTFINTPSSENTIEDNESSAPGAMIPSTSPFKPNETEHVKFSYYDPFGSESNRFVVVLNEQKFCYPYPGKFLSAYGQRGRSMHTGVDIKGVKNDTIRAAFAGTVRMSKPYSGYGNCVVIRHKNGLETLYGHNSRNLVRVGEPVKAGDPIALIGRTGRATTEHCHFEVRVQGQHINPALMLDCDNQRLRSGVLSITRQGNRIYASNKNSGLAPSRALDTDDSDSPSALAAGGGETRLASSSSIPASSKSQSTSSSSSVHTVKSGDTLWGIAKRYGTTVAKICTLNNLEREATLPLGKKLKVK